MYQLVNMYQPIFRQQPKILSAVTLMTIIGIVIVLMFSLYLKAASTMQGLQRTSSGLALNYSQLKARLGPIRLNSAREVDETVSNEAAVLQSQIDERSALLQRIDSLLVESHQGFATVFESLAKTDLPGLWLTGVQLDELGSVKISGTTLDPKLVPRYLQLIAEQPLLSTLVSGSVNLSRDDSSLPEIDFVLSYNSPGERQ